MEAWGNEWVRIGALAAAVLALAALAEIWKRFGRPDPESTRKLVHFGSGLGCALLPFLVKSPGIVLLFCLALLAATMLVRRRGMLRSLHGVTRRTWGMEYYPVSIFLLFLLARDRPWLYVSGVL